MGVPVADDDSKVRLVLAVERCVVDTENTGHWDTFTKAFHERFDGDWAGRLDVLINPKPATFGKEAFMPAKQADQWLKGSGQPKDVVAAVKNGSKVIDISEGTPLVMNRDRVVRETASRNRVACESCSVQYPTTFPSIHLSIYPSTSIR